MKILLPNVLKYSVAGTYHNFCYIWGYRVLHAEAARVLAACQPRHCDYSWRLRVRACIRERR